MGDINIGEIVVAGYNSGTYIGKVLEDRRKFFLVEVLAVESHPTQGDLHNPGQAEGVAFFERKALAHKEKMNAGKRRVHAYDGEIPNYSESLKAAVIKLKEELSVEDTLFNQTALKRLESLEEHYYKKTDY